MQIAIEGCCHGQLDAIYKHVRSLESKNKYKVDLLLICGDFQAIRNHRDLQCMAVPPKYRELGGFHKYYTGESVAPMLTVVIGGNHEASNYLWELYHGGWVAPNIYFLGHAGCVQVNGIRIAGASGIFNPRDFRQGHWEQLPYDHTSMRSIYHIREYNIRRLSLLSSPHIFLSHDWPQSIEHHGDLPDLLRRKPFFREDVRTGKLGSPPLMGLLRTLQPQWWFSAHLHVRFEATVAHAGQPAQEGERTSEARNPDEIMLEDEEEVVAAPPPAVYNTETKFLALDKCLPRGGFLEVIEMAAPLDSPEGATLCYDPEWLAITRAFHPYFTTAFTQTAFPDEGQARAMVAREHGWVLENVMAGSETLRVEECQVFARTAPGPGHEGRAKTQQPPLYTNPQTEGFCRMLGLENRINPVSASAGAANEGPGEGVHMVVAMRDETGVVRDDEARTGED